MFEALIQQVSLCLFPVLLQFRSQQLLKDLHFLDLSASPFFVNVECAHTGKNPVRGTPAKHRSVNCLVGPTRFSCQALSTALVWVHSPWQTDADNKLIRNTSGMRVIIYFVHHSLNKKFLSAFISSNPLSPSLQGLFSDRLILCKPSWTLAATQNRHMASSDSDNCTLKYPPKIYKRVYCAEWELFSTFVKILQWNILQEA